MKNIVLLGSTGSIGGSALRVAEKLSNRLRLKGLAVNKNYRLMLKQAERFNVRHVAVADAAMAEKCADEAPRGITVHKGAEGLEELVSLDGTDIVLCAIVGMAGLRPVLTAVRNGTDVALATKEALVAAGHIVTRACSRSGARLLPVDSEHSAIFQCMEGRERAVRRIILTASGGPFASKPKINLDKVTVGEVLRHPRWNMGRKVTVDSATLMNKGLEIMEARWLFNLPLDRIDVVVHPESIVHSVVEFIDGSALAQLSPPDMRFAVQYALTWPERCDGGLPGLDLTSVGVIRFMKPDTKRFPCLAMARESARIGGTMPTVLNAANEVAVQRFLDGLINFSGIWRTVEQVMNCHRPVASPGLEEIFEADRWAREQAARRT